MAKKSHIKVRMVPESNPDSKFIYYAKKPTKGEKVKEKLKLKKYNPNTRKHEFFVEKKDPLTLPPDYENLPTPTAAQGSNENTTSIKEKLKTESFEEETPSTSSSNEESILRQIRKK